MTSMPSSPPVLAPMRTGQRGRRPPTFYPSPAYRAVFDRHRIEYRVKLGVWDAIVEGHGWSMTHRMAGAKILRTDDLFAAIGFLLRNGESK